MQTRYTLLERVKNRSDEDSWSDFVEIYRPYIFSIIRRMNLNHQDCEDLSQSILVVLWEKIPQFKANFRTGAFRRWLTTLVKNRVVNYLVKHNNRSEKMADNAEDIAKQINSMPDDQLYKMFEEEWEDYVAMKAWEALEDEFSEKFKTVFQMCMKNISAEEIAEKVGIAVPSVYVYRKTVTDSLKKKIKELRKLYL